LNNSLDGEVIVPLSELNRMRRQVVEELETLRAKPKRWTTNEFRVPGFGFRVGAACSNPKPETRNSELLPPGSNPEPGTRNPELIVLVRDLPQASFSAVDLFAGHREMTPGATRTGNLIGVEYLTDRALADLRRRQDEYERALELLASDGRSRAARVQAWQWLRSLHGWAGGEKYVSMALMTPVLRDGSTAAHWTRALSLETWCSAMIVSHLLEHERLWLRAQMHRAGHPTVAAAFGRGAWEQLFQAYLVSRGTVRWKPRWILDAVRQLDDPPLFACARRAIFPRPDEAEPYLRWTEREAPSLIGRIAEQAPDALRPLMDQLAPCSAPAYD